VPPQNAVGPRILVRMAIPKPTGRPPVPDSQRRRRNKPASYGLAESVLAGQARAQPDLAFKAHTMITDLWTALGKSVEGQFYSDADWQRARLEMFYLNGLLTGERSLTAPAWSVVQHGLNELLVSPADKRRAGIALKQSAVDPDEVHAAAQIAEYRERLKSV
jgi:hypothetical protein